MGESIRDHLHRIEEHLLAKRWRDAATSAKVLLRDFDARVVGGEAAGPLIGMALLFRAVAHAGLGEEEKALWDWYSAVALLPGLRESDLGKFGEPGEWLAARRPEPEKDWAQAPGPGLGEAKPGAAISPPRRLKARPPAYPKGLRLSCREGKVTLAMVINEKGEPAKPSVVEAPGGAVIALAALETVRDWRFQPAQLDGKPVTVYYTLTVEFSIPGCP